MALLTVAGRSALCSMIFLGHGHAQVKFEGMGVVDPPHQGLSLSIGSGARPLMYSISVAMCSLIFDFLILIESMLRIC